MIFIENLSNVPLLLLILWQLAKGDSHLVEPTSNQLRLHMATANSGANQAIGHLESMDDLELVAQLSMRNFNISDRSLLFGATSWLGGAGSNTGSGGVASQERQQESGEASLTSGSSSGTSQSSDAPPGGPFKAHFLHHHRSDVKMENRLALMLESFIWHLRNGHLRRLKLEELRELYLNLDLKSFDIIKPNASQTNSSSSSQDLKERCHYLVAIYKQEQQAGEAAQLVASQLEANLKEEDKLEKRLQRLCRLAVKCHSADELVQLISGPWISNDGGDMLEVKSKQWEREGPASEGSIGGHEDQEDLSSQRPTRIQSSSLRDSLSLSLAKLCPLILFQLHDDDGLCSLRRDDRPPMVTVWAFATLFVTIVSFCSLIGLSITPLLGHEHGSPVAHLAGSEASGLNSLASPQKPPNKACLTLFEGLAVGSLVGSALFSLIPQAFELQERESNQGFLLKALIIFFGIYLFFCSERLMRLILDRRQQRKKRKRVNLHRSSNSMMQQQPPSTTVVCGVDSAAQRPLHQGADLPATGDIQSKTGKVALEEATLPTDRCGTTAAKSVNFPQTARHQVASQQAKARSHLKQVRRRRKTRHQLSSVARRKRPMEQQQQQKWRQNLSSSNSSSPSGRDYEVEDEDDYCDEDDYFELEHKLELEEPISSFQSFKSARIQPNDNSNNKSSRTKRRLATQPQPNRQFAFGEEHFFASRQVAARSPHGDPTSSLPVAATSRDISTVAWMIVLGDGLHNFIDGISIGAAFSESILSGVSISVAVICEEFPHELGDFAVLVSSGMTVRQALGYNFLSACTCYFGMAVGIILGDVNDGASYISALAAGVFLYIALVDMMGELSATLEETSRDSIGQTLKLLLLQNVGIFIGISIIFILSFIDF